MIDIQFNEIRNVLLNPSNEHTDARQKTHALASLTKIASVALGIISGVCTVNSAITALTLPVLGPIVGLPGVAVFGGLCAVAHDTFKIANNILNILEKPLIRAYCSTSAGSFINTLFQETILAAPLLSKHAIENLNKPRDS